MALMEAGSDLQREAPEKLKALCPKEVLVAGRFSTLEAQDLMWWEEDGPEKRLQRYGG